MNMRNKAQTCLAALFALFAAAVLVGVDLPARAQNSNSSTTTEPPAATQDARATEGTQEDLSGTFTGNVRTSGGHEMSAPSTLTITGNQFTLAATDGSMTHSGTITAINSRGYIGAALRFSDATDTASNTPLTFSVRARRSGDRLTLSPAPGARNKMWFTPGGGARRGRRRATEMAPPPPTPEPTPTPPAG